MNPTLEQLKYPIGPFHLPSDFDSESRISWIEAIASFPARLKKEVLYLSDEQLATCYRPEGWTIRQVVHHCADSHMNSLIRLKWTLTEEHPTIKPYFEERWAELIDSSLPIHGSLLILDGVHERLTFLMKNLGEADLQRTFVHPEHGKIFNLHQLIANYAWHSNHHLAHITELKKRRAWDSAGVS